LVPGDDLVPPAQDGATERTDLDRTGGILEIGTELTDELVGQLRVGDLVDGADDFLSRNRPWAPVVAGVR